jgi:hypothetical protein
MVCCVRYGFQGLIPGSSSPGASFTGGKDLGSVVLGHAVAVGLVIVLNLVKPVWSRAAGKVSTALWSEAVEMPF